MDGSSWPPGTDLCDIPSGTPPEGVIPNFENPETLVSVLISVPILLEVILVVFTACRIFANKRNLLLSDHFVLVAAILSIAHTGLLVSQTKYARHQWDVRACWYTEGYPKLLFCQEIVAAFTLFFSKASIFLLFQQLFEVTNRMRIAIRGGIIFTALLYIIINIPLGAILNAPRAGRSWTTVITEGHSVKVLIWGVIQSVLAIGLDLFIFILPIPVIMKLHLSTRKKVRLIAVFTTALIGVLACVLSLVYRIQALDTNDGTWKYTALLICNLVEIDVAIIVSCTPGFANFTKVYMSKINIFKSPRRDINYDVESKDPNKPRTGRRFGKPRDYLSLWAQDTYNIQSTSATRVGISTEPVSSHSMPSTPQYSEVRYGSSVV
ncbi:hypothetical protein F4808DRAFT_439918 [Astrocystis sublimbata]|nr:hypothetical protein F4808DRAFT_439918 [Astrocystis sublimbata]